MEGENEDEGFTLEPKKVIIKKIENFEFRSFGGVNFIFRSNLHIYYNFKMTRRAGCFIPTRRVIRMQRNIHFSGLRQIGTFKDFK